MEHKDQDINQENNSAQAEETFRSLITLITYEPEITRGHVYTVFRGTFGTCQSVYVKKIDRKRTSGTKKHEDLALNDIRMMQTLSIHRSIMDYLHSEGNATELSVAVYAYDENCKDYLSALQRGERQEDEYDLQSLFKQLFSVLSFLHNRSIVHRDIRLKNLYINKYTASEWNLKLGGLKYADYYENIKKDDSSGPEVVDVLLPASIPGYGYQSDKFQVAFIMYCFLKKQPVRQTDGPFIPDWTGDDSYSFEKLHLKHLAKVILNSSALHINDILTHPFFMSIFDLEQFESMFEGYNYRHREMDPHMEQDKTEVFTGDWTTGLDPEILRACAPENPPPAFTESFVGLWRARQNIRDDEVIVPWETKTFEFWEKRNPAFFLHLFQRLITYRAPNELDLFYAKKDNTRPKLFLANPKGGFYEACASQTIYG